MEEYAELSELVNAYVSRKDFSEEFIPWLEEEVRKLSKTNYGFLAAEITSQLARSTGVSHKTVPAKRKDYPAYFSQLEEALYKHLNSKNSRFETGDRVVTPEGLIGEITQFCGDHYHVKTSGDYDAQYMPEKLKPAESRLDEEQKNKGRAQELVRNARQAVEEKYKLAEHEQAVGELIRKAVNAGAKYASAAEIARLLAQRLPEYIQEISLLTSVPEQELEAKIKSEPLAGTASKVKPRSLIAQLLTEESRGYEKEEAKKSQYNKPVKYVTPETEQKYFRPGDVVTDASKSLEGKIERFVGTDRLHVIWSDLSMQVVKPTAIKLKTPVLQPGDLIEVVGRYPCIDKGSWGYVTYAVPDGIEVEFCQIGSQKLNAPKNYGIVNAISQNIVKRLATREVLEYEARRARE